MICRPSTPHPRGTAPLHELYMLRVGHAQPLACLLRSMNPASLAPF